MTVTRHRGFTLIELMIVIAIIAILAALALPAYQDYLIRAQISEGLELASGAKSAVWDFAANVGHLPTDNLSVGLPDPASISGHYVNRVAVYGGDIRVTFAGPNVNTAISNGVLLLSPTFDEGGIRWQCSAISGIAPQYMPTVCR